MLANYPICPVLSVVDLDRARKFYEEMLDLTPIGGHTDGHQLYQCGQGTVLMIYVRPEPPKAENTVAGWSVEGIEAVVDELRAKGVIFEQYDMGPIKTDEKGISTMGESKSAWFKDPDGNILAISQQ